MSDLQISLLVIGAVVVVAVYLFNWVQARRLQRRLERTFGSEHEDVLLQPAPAAAGPGQRVEPLLQPQETPENAAPDETEDAADMPEPAAALPASCFDEKIFYIAHLDASARIPEDEMEALLASIAACGKPVCAAGFNAEIGAWEDLGQIGVSYDRLCLALQLVNRGGPVSPEQLDAFCDAVSNCAETISATVTLGDAQEALARARELDNFCAEVDVAIGINIVAPAGVQFAGTRIRALAEAAGFKLEPGGVFHYRDDERRTLFTLDNHEPAPFIPEQIKSLSTGGITLLLDVPRVAGGLEVLDRMVEIAKNFAQALGGRLVDDNRVALNDTGIVKIRQQLGSIHDVMDKHDVGAGGERALRLFS